jgi:hypothetical protein
MRKSRVSLTVQGSPDVEQKIIDALIEVVKKLRNEGIADSAHLETNEVNVPVAVDL